jgi:4-hydroxybenzoate polyprenyltransferase
MSIQKYLSLVKFSHTLFAMPFALIGYFLGVEDSGNQMSWKLLGLVVLCMVFARNAAMAFNRYLDRNFDRINPRTAIREIPSGVVSSGSALVFVIINSVFFVVTAWFINALCFYLSFVALAVILGYSFTKRFTALCHFVLGIGLSLAPIGAYIAVTGKFSLLPLMFSFLVFTWVSGFDIIYALQDEPFDRANNLKSVPVLIGVSNSLVLSSLLHVVTALFSFAAWWYGGMGGWYLAGAFIFTGLLVYQHTLVKPGDFTRINLAFFTTNGIGSVVFAAFFLLDFFF